MSLRELSALSISSSLGPPLSKWVSTDGITQRDPVILGHGFNNGGGGYHTGSTAIHGIAIKIRGRIVVDHIFCRIHVVTWVVYDWNDIIGVWTITVSGQGRVIGGQEPSVAVGQISINNRGLSVVCERRNSGSCWGSVAIDGSVVIVVASKSVVVASKPIIIVATTKPVVAPKSIVVCVDNAIITNECGGSGCCTKGYHTQLQVHIVEGLRLCAIKIEPPEMDKRKTLVVLKYLGLEWRLVFYQSQIR